MRIMMVVIAAVWAWAIFFPRGSVCQEPALAIRARSELALIIERGLEQASAQRGASEKRRALVELVQLGMANAGDNALARERFEQALRDERSLGDRKSAKLLKRVLADSLEDLTFQPTMEAKLPDGFPELTPVGEIQWKEYPKYRMARTTMNGRDNDAFMTLFFHIKKRNIAMTAPVEMTYSVEIGKTVERTAMAFLYQNTDLGSPGQDAKVEVVDVPAMNAVSMGVRGNLSEQEVEKVRAQLERWLAEHENRYRASGPLRVLGYNSPFLPSGRRYSEVQIPCEQVRAER